MNTNINTGYLRLPEPAPVLTATRFSAPLLLGVALALMGTWIIAGWFIHSAAMVQLVPGLVAMVFNTALCFLLAGAALILTTVERTWAKQAVSFVGVILWLLGSWIFFENISDARFTVDWPSLHNWLHDDNPHPGRMAPNTALGFALAGLILVLKNRTHQPAWARAIIVLSFCVLMLGVTGLIGYSLKLDTLYSWFKGARMAILTAVGMIMLGLGLLSACLRLSTRKHALRPDERISLIGALVLLVVSLSTGLAGFIALQTRTKDEIARGLDLALQGRATLVETAISEGRERSVMLAAFVRASPQFKATFSTHSPAAFDQLKTMLEQRAAASKLKSITWTAADGRIVIAVGTRLSATSFITTLKNPDSQVVWNNDYNLRTVVPVSDESGQALGALIIVRALPGVQKLLMSKSGYGDTGETGLCNLQTGKVYCLPQYMQPVPYETAFISAGADKGPMSLALIGKRGIFVGLDYRQHEVIAAYTPVGQTGLGMVLKQDTWEIFQPISDQLKRALPIILLLIAAGIALLRSQVKPLARRLVDSEAEARTANTALAAEERRIRAILDHLGEGIITMDSVGIIRSVNPSACLIFGYSVDEMLDQELAMLIPADMRERHRAGMKRYLQGGAPRVVDKGAIELTGLHKSGGTFPIELSVTSVSVGDDTLFVGIVRDISEREHARKALHDEKERLRVTLHSIGDAVITTDTQGRVIYLNPIAQEMTGWPKDEAQGRNIEEIFNIIDGLTGERAPCPVELVLATGDVVGLAENTEMIKRDGSRIAINDSAAPIRGEDGYVSGVVIVFHDVTHARRMAEQISYQATHDALTDLVNRREFERRLGAALLRADNTKGLSLLYLDLDQFKLINDTCGHVAGDELLKQITMLVRSRLRSEDTLARLGGDEFAVLLENCPPDVALRVAESIRQTVHDLQFVWEEKGFTVGVSIGLVSRDGDQSMSDLLKAADSACYVAKDKGRNRVHVYREADVEVMRRNGEMSWVARIEHALRDDRFQLFVQPIADLSWLKGVAHVHYEVLVRMLDEEGRLVPPMAFIPAAERYGLMPAIDRWIVAHALDLLEQRAPDAAKFGLSINLSATSINDESFLPFLREQLTRNIDTADVCFEVTETAAIASLTQSSRMMHELKALGCSFSLDDFGSGMSSFAYLKNLPVDYVKIDGGFVKDIEDDLIDRAMVAAINDIAHVMGIRTIAEFVESSDILKRLNAIGVDFVQGYAIGKPMPASELAMHRETSEVE